MTTWQKYLKESKLDESLSYVLADLEEVFVDLWHAFSATGNDRLEGKIENMNPTGDMQAKMDVYSNQLFVDKLSKNGAISILVSEENIDPIIIDKKRDGLVVVFDPLDGSSIVDMNMSVGSIVGVYKGEGVKGLSGRDQKAAIMAVYGPSLSVMVTTGEGVIEFIYDLGKKELVLQNEHVHIPESGPILAPGGMKGCGMNSWYCALFNKMMEEDYSLRYSGGMVPDINHIIKKGGIYMYPGTKEKPGGKLRLLYELAPLAMIIEQTGGLAIDGKNEILDIVVSDYHQKSPFFAGSKHEIDLVRKHIPK
ncbi:fructose-bisphosphatase class I [Candidatus Peregrinibacteria bacterium]|nr:fructose-bisphosphatase class I [Candidatus Peregrinibacteria bacterium]